MAIEIYNFLFIFTYITIMTISDTVVADICTNVQLDNSVSRDIKGIQ